MLQTTVSDRVLQVDILGAVSKLVHNPRNHRGVNMHVFLFLSQQCTPDGVKCAEEIKKHNPHCATRLFQVGVAVM